MTLLRARLAPVLLALACPSEESKPHEIDPCDLTCQACAEETVFRCNPCNENRTFYCDQSLCTNFEGYRLVWRESSFPCSCIGADGHPRYDDPACWDPATDDPTDSTP